MSTNRREFLRHTLAGSAVVSLGGSVPWILQQAGGATRESPTKILVVIQLTGGNDGLNTVIPFRDDQYYGQRPTLAVPRDDQRTIAADVALHPALAGLERLWNEGRLALLQGVGYDQPNRSHFESMDIWHTARRKSQRREEGWLGKLLDQRGGEVFEDLPALHLGSEEQPLALAARRTRVPSIGSLDRFRLSSRDASSAVRTIVEGEVPETTNDGHELLGFVESSTTSAWAASRRIEQVLQAQNSQASYPRTPLAEKLQVIARLMDAGLPASIYYVSLDGFDTHAQQPEIHASLLRQWSEALAAFHDDLTDMGHAERVLTLTFSEFGRRVRENASDGTDHGAAAPVFVTGPRVQPGIHGSHPSLDDLDDGDLRHHTDFRRIYATLIDGWLGGDSAVVLGDRYEHLPIL